MRRCCASLGLILLSVWNVGRALTCRTTTRRYSAAPLRLLRSNRDLTGSSPSPACMERKLDDPLNEIVSRSKGHRPRLCEQPFNWPEVITRLLGAPGNWTLETISDLLLGIAGEELEPTSSSLLNR